MTGIILAHGGASAVVERHMPIWRESLSELIFISPADDPIYGAMLFGTSERNGRCTIERMMVACLIASKYPVAAVLEYDALILRKLDDVPANSLVGSELFPNVCSAFTAPVYSHCPWIARSETWNRIARAGAQFELGYSDRWLSLAAHNAGVEMIKVNGCFSRDVAWSDDDRKQAHQSIRNGAPLVHGIKTAQDYEAAVSALTP